MRGTFAAAWVGETGSLERSPIAKRSAQGVPSRVLSVRGACMFHALVWGTRRGPRAPCVCMRAEGDIGEVYGGSPIARDTRKYFDYEQAPATSIRTVDCVLTSRGPFAGDRFSSRMPRKMDFSSIEITGSHFHRVVEQMEFVGLGTITVTNEELRIEGGRVVRPLPRLSLVR